MQNQIPKNAPGHSRMAKEGWQKVKLGEVAEVLNGYAFSSQSFIPKNDHALPVFKMGNIKQGGGIQWTGKEDYFPENRAQHLMHFVTEPGDILMCMTDMKANVRLLGYSAFIKDEKFLVNQRVGRVKAKRDKVDSRFLYYYLNSPSFIGYIRSTARSGVQVNLTTDEIRQSSLFIPNYLEQKQIASNLSSFDDKIEVNNKIAKILEEMAQALFKEWFVKFRFPGYKKAEFVDLPAESSAQAGSKLGKIPEGWEVKKIKDVAKINKGISYSSEEIKDNSVGLPMINLANFQRGGGFNPDGIKFYTGRYKITDLVKPGDIVIAMTDLTSNREVIGHPARIPSYSHWDKMLISLDVCLVDTEKLYMEFLYYLMLRKEFSYLMASSAGGTNVAHLNKSVIANYSFVLPERNLIQEFQDFIRPIFSQINKVELENQKLAALRDLLLPKLMRGEIKV